MHVNNRVPYGSNKAGCRLLGKDPDYALVVPFEYRNTVPSFEQFEQTIRRERARAKLVAPCFDSVPCSWCCDMSVQIKGVYALTLIVSCVAGE